MTDRQKKPRTRPRLRQPHPSVLRWSVLGSILLGCGARGLEANFDTGWRADGPSSDRREEALGILTQLDTATPAPEIPAVVGLTGRGMRGRTLPNGRSWHYQGTVDVLPSLSGGLVAFSGDGNVTVLDVRTGKLRFTLPVGGRRLEGMSSDGKKLVLLLVDSDDARPDQVLITSDKGRIIDAATSLSRVGTPLAVSGMALLPWNGLYVSAFDLRTGAPLGRLLVRDGVHRVESFAGEPWVLGTGASHIDARLVDTVGREPLRLNLEGLPGDPVWPVDGSKPRLPRARPVAVWAEPQFVGRPKFREELFVYGYFDLIMGLDVRTQAVRWTNYFKRPIVGGASSPEGVSLCLEDGSVHAVSLPRGEMRRLTSLDARLKACVLTASRNAISRKSTPPVPHQIQRTIRNTSPSMAAAHEFLLRDLAGQEGASATRALLAIARDPLASSSLATRAAEYLANRRSGSTAMLQALEDGAPPAEQRSLADPAEAGERGDGQSPPTGPLAGSSPSSKGSGEEEARGEEFDFELPTTGLRPAPVEALARALTAMKVEKAAPILVRYLRTPSISGGPTLAVMEALTALGDKRQLPEVREYFFRYKNAGGDDASIDALGLAASFLLNQGDEDDEARVRASVGDLLTHPDVKQELIEVLKVRDTSQAPAAEMPSPSRRGPSSDSPVETNERGRTNEGASRL